MSTIFMCNETSMTKKGLFLNYGWPMHPGFGVELHTVYQRNTNCVFYKVLVRPIYKHGCPSGPRGYVKAVMCSHSWVRVPLRAFLILYC